MTVSLTASEIAPLVKCPVFAADGLVRSGRMVEAFADFPGLFLVAHGALQIAPGHVETDRIAVDVIERLLHRDVLAARLQRRHQFHLVVVILGERWIGMIADRADRDVLNRIGRLLEKERRLPGRVGAHFARMGGIVAADAIDATHRKYVGFADDGNGAEPTGKIDFGPACAAAGPPCVAAPASANAPVARMVLRSTISMPFSLWFRFLVPRLTAYLAPRVMRASGAIPPGVTRAALLQRNELVNGSMRRKRIGTSACPILTFPGNRPSSLHHLSAPSRNTFAIHRSSSASATSMITSCATSVSTAANCAPRPGIWPHTGAP